MKPGRPKFEQRRIVLRGQEQVERAIGLLRHVPLDPDKPLELIVREETKPRKMDQNALMWAGPLRDMQEQAWLHGRQFGADIWHEFFKRQFLPEEFDPELCLEGYRKWDIDPEGNRVLVGSTKQLTVRGMSQHLEQVYAFGATLGVQFHEVQR